VTTYSDVLSLKNLHFVLGNVCKEGVFSERRLQSVVVR